MFDFVKFIFNVKDDNIVRVKAWKSVELAKKRECGFFKKIDEIIQFRLLRFKLACTLILPPN